MKSLDTHLVVGGIETLIGVMELLYDDDDLLWSLIGYGTPGMMKNPMEPLMNTMIPLKISWMPLLALDIVRWHDDVVFGDLMKSCNLVKTLLPLLALDVVKTTTHTLY